MAREIHRPILEVLEYPMTELRMWAAVFQEEYFEQHPRERYLDREKRRLSDVECNSEQEKLERMMKRAKKPADE